MKPIELTSEKLSDYGSASTYEWLETNGLGGYASGTVSGANTRKYHGLLVASMNPPVERKVVLSKLEETIIVGDQHFELGANQYPGAVHPQGFRFLKHFKKSLFPEFTYEAGGVTLKKTIAAIHGENTTVILYEVERAPKAFTLELLPLTSCRDFHHLCQANDAIYRGYIFDGGIFETKNYHDSPELFISVPESEFIPGGHWYYHFEYEAERQRGLDFKEDLFNYGKFVVKLKKGSRLGIVISTEHPGERDAMACLQQEQQRREKIIQPYTNDHLAMLALAADQFVVKRGENLKTIIAGYHWFSDWGRDTMIALPGLCLCTGRFDDAKKILQAFASSVSEGMLPNRFPDYGEAPEYNTVDASLWFFNAVYNYHRATNDTEFIKRLMPVLEDIIDWHYKGTRYNIHVDVDELVAAGGEGVQLTWMDAKVDDWVVTPRKGKAVEINALWYNALSILGELTNATGHAEKIRYTEMAERVEMSFNKVFWNESSACLYDYIDGNYCSDDLRPNQLFAISLPFTMLSVDRAAKVMEVVTRTLLTPKGLRSLSPDNREYKEHYEGDRWHRDGAYHQGTVWSYLLGPYVDALVLLEGDKGKMKAKKIVEVFLTHLREAGIGTVSEIFDAELPHHPRGCIAQAWGVAEVLRIAVAYDLLS